MGSIEEFQRLVAAFETGRLVPPVDSVYRLDAIRDAFDRLEHEDRIGKVIVEIAAN